jgi:rSAM/selenodomain-associated transferase 2
LLSVIIPTLNAERTLADTLTALIPATIEGVVNEVIIADGGSTDMTLEIADGAGATIVRTEKGRGQQMHIGAKAARQTWLLFLHADTVLDPGWSSAAVAFIDAVDSGKRQPGAAAFKFRLDDDGLGAGLVEFGVGLRCCLFRLPYGDQGLLIPKRLYDELGGFKMISLFEDVDIVRRLGRSRIRMLRPAAVTSALKYREEGYAARVLRNWACLAMYFVGVPVGRIEKFYR